MNLYYPTPCVQMPGPPEKVYPEQNACEGVISGSLLTVYESSDLSHPDSVLRGEFCVDGTRISVGSQGSDSGVRQFGSSVRFTQMASPLGGGTSPLRHHVAHVVLTRSEEQVFGPYTQRRIARVAHVHSGWDRAVSQLPCETVSVDHPLTFAATTERSVPPVRASRPQPARFCLVDLRPEARLDGVGFVAHTSSISQARGI